MNGIAAETGSEKASKALGRIERGLASVAEQQGRISAAKEHAKRSFEVFDRLMATTGDSEEIKNELAVSESVLKRLNATSEASPQPPDRLP